MRKDWVDKSRKEFIGGGDGGKRREEGRGMSNIRLRKGIKNDFGVP